MVVKVILPSLLVLLQTCVPVSLHSNKTFSSSQQITQQTFTTAITPNASRLLGITTSHQIENIYSSGNSSKRTQVLILYISVSVAASSILFVAFLLFSFCRAERKKKKISQTVASAPIGEVPLLPENDMPAPLLRKDIWEIPRNRLELDKKLGEGAFGFVFKAILTTGESSAEKKVVAVKMVKEEASSSDREDLLAELEIMKKLKPHPHVVSLIGAVRNDVNCPLVIVEFVPFGDLLGYLRKVRGVQDVCYFDSDHVPKAKLCTSQELMKFAIESAQGMEYLSMKKIVHRDLAARNILVGEGKTCKITDFGMARDIRRDEIYLRSTRGLIPVKWTAIESILRGIYTTRSDVWSFGILLFEILTVGGSPYPGMNGYQVRDFISQGKRIPKPMHLDNELYQVMMDCWHPNPRKRPTFKQLVYTLKRLEPCHEEYINLSEYSSCDYQNIERFHQEDF